MAARVDEHGAIAGLRQVLGAVAQALLAIADAVQHEDGGARRPLRLDDLDGERGRGRPDVDEALAAARRRRRHDAVLVGRVDDRVRADALERDVAERPAR